MVIVTRDPGSGSFQSAASFSMMGIIIGDMDKESLLGLRDDARRGGFAAPV